MTGGDEAGGLLAGALICCALGDDAEGAEILINDADIRAVARACWVLALAIAAATTGDQEMFKAELSGELVHLAAGGDPLGLDIG
jgi:hypothetical protein